MSTPEQRAAGRADAPDSTGTITQGQPASRFNAAKHGIFAHTQIMFDETAGDLAELAAEYHQHHNPADPGQRFLVDTLINNEWRLRRLRRVDAEIWQSASNAFLEKRTEAPACSSGDAFATAAPTFERLQRTVNSCERIYHRALKELQRQQAKVGQTLSSANVPANVPANPGPLPQQAEPAGPDAEPAHTPQPEQSKPTSAKLASFRQNPQTPPRAAPKPPDTPPFASPDASANAAEPQPSASDRDPKPPQTA
jgi:hypothetical protein